MNMDSCQRISVASSGCDCSPDADIVPGGEGRDRITSFVSDSNVESGCETGSTVEKSLSSRRDSMDFVEDCLRDLKADLSFESPERWLFLQRDNELKESSRDNVEDLRESVQDCEEDESISATESVDEDSDSVDSEACRYLTDSSEDDADDGENNDGSENNDDRDVSKVTSACDLNENSDESLQNRFELGENCHVPPQPSKTSKCCTGIGLVTFDVSPKRIGGRSVKNDSSTVLYSQPTVNADVSEECCDADCSLCRDVTDDHIDVNDATAGSSSISWKAGWHNSNTSTVTSKVGSGTSSRLNLLKNGLVRRMRSASLRSQRHCTTETSSALSSHLDNETSSIKSPSSVSPSTQLRGMSIRKFFRSEKKSTSVDIPSDSQLVSVDAHSRRRLASNNGIRPASYCNGSTALENFNFSDTERDLTSVAAEVHRENHQDSEICRAASKEFFDEKKLLDCDGSSQEINQKSDDTFSKPDISKYKQNVKGNSAKLSLGENTNARNSSVGGKVPTITADDTMTQDPVKSITSTYNDYHNKMSNEKAQNCASSSSDHTRKSEQIQPCSVLGRLSHAAKQARKCSLDADNIAAAAEKFFAGKIVVTTRPPRKSEVDRISERVQREEKMKKKRKQVLKELVDTEITYQRHLDLIIRLFEDPLNSLRLLEDHITVTIFGNVRQIISVNEELLRHFGTMDVGRAFLRVSPFLKVYSTYANNHERALATLMEWDQRCVEFSQFRRQQEELEEMNGLKLNALLITPVQRVPRYKLLLEELLTCTDQSDIEHVAIEEAVIQVSEVANHINEHIKQQDNFMKMIAIQKSLSCSVGPRIIVPGRVFIKEGRLMKVSARGGRSYERMFFLFSDMLMYAKPRLLDGGGCHSYVCCCILPLHHCKVQRVLGQGKGQGSLFTIQCKQESLLLYSDQKSVDSWIAVLSKAVDEHQVNRQTLRKNSSAKEPVRRSGIARLWKKERQDDPLVNRGKSSQDKSIRVKQRQRSPRLGCRGRNEEKDSFKSASSFSIRRQNQANALFRSKVGRSARVGVNQENVDPDLGDRGAGRLKDSVGCDGSGSNMKQKSESKASTPVQLLRENFGCLTPRSRKDTDTLPFRPTTVEENSRNANTFSFFGHHGETVDLDTIQNCEKSAVTHPA